VPRFQQELRDQIRADGTIYEQIRDQGELSDELTEKLDEALQRFKQGFNVQSEDALVTP
jgi:F0F1-type ATP synthase alpha subunit